MYPAISTEVHKDLERAEAGQFRGQRRQGQPPRPQEEVQKPKNLRPHLRRRARRRPETPDEPQGRRTVEEQGAADAPEDADAA